MSKPETALFRYFTLVRAVAIAAALVIMLSSCGKTGIQDVSGSDVSSTEVLPTIEPAELFGEFDEEAAEEMMTSINAIRVREGLEPYLTNDDLMEWARVRAAEIVILFEHKRPDGSSIVTAYPGESATKFESSLAMGFETTQAVIHEYQVDDIQRNRILNEEYTHFGVACLTYSGSKYWTVVYLLP